jgi:outer membrane lipoprotein SlyB
MKKLITATLATLAAAAALADNPHGLPPGIAWKMHGHEHEHERVCDECGRVESVRHEKRKGEGGVLGIVAGAAAGGLLGNQVGRGNGKTLATVGGAVAGGYAGNEVQKHVSSKDLWITQVKMRDGSVRSFEQESQPAWKSGAIVKVHGRGLAAY